MATEEERAQRAAKRQDALEKLLAVLPHIRIAQEMAEIEAPGAHRIMGIGYKTPTGGRLVARMDLDEFVANLSTLIEPRDPNAPPRCRPCKGCGVTMDFEDHDDWTRCADCRRDPDQEGPV